MTTITKKVCFTFKCFIFEANSQTQRTNAIFSPVCSYDNISVSLLVFLLLSIALE